MRMRKIVAGNFLKSSRADSEEVVSVGRQVEVEPFPAELIAAPEVARLAEEGGQLDLLPLERGAAEGEVALALGSAEVHRHQPQLASAALPFPGEEVLSGGVSVPGLPD